MRRFHEVHTNWEICDRRKRISIKEKGKVYRALNSEEKIIIQYHIDAIENINQNKKKCDYALYVYDNLEALKDDDRVIFIELKGKNIKKAILQIEVSINDLVQSHRLKPKRIDARIVASGVPKPNILRSDLIRLRTSLVKYGNGVVEIGTNGNYEERL